MVVHSLDTTKDKSCYNTRLRSWYNTRSQYMHPTSINEDIGRDWYYSQFYSIDITQKNQFDITHKLISITGGPYHRVPSMRILNLILLTSLVLILLTRLNLILLTSFTIQHHHLNRMRIHRIWYDTSLENDSWSCTINT